MDIAKITQSILMIRPLSSSLLQVCFYDFLQIIHLFIVDLEPFQTVLLSIGSALTIALLFIAGIQWWYIFNYVSSEQRRNKLYLLISLFPVCRFFEKWKFNDLKFQICSWCCLVGMFCPRTALLVSSFGLLYFLLCLFVLVSLMRHLAGGRAALAHSLTEKGKMINFRSPPFCCLFFCLPQARPSMFHLFYQSNYITKFKCESDSIGVDCSTSSHHPSDHRFWPSCCGDWGQRKCIQVSKINKNFWP